MKVWLTLEKTRFGDRVMLWFDKPQKVYDKFIESVSLSSYKDVEWDLSIINSGLEDVTKSDPVDACVEMIYKLKERDLL